MKEELKLKIYQFCRNTRDMKKAESIISLIERNVINKDNYWNEINGFVNNCKSEKTKIRWKEIGEFIESLVYN